MSALWRPLLTILFQSCVVTDVLLFRCSSATVVEVQHSVFLLEMVGGDQVLNRFPCLPARLNAAATSKTDGRLRLPSNTSVGGDLGSFTSTGASVINTQASDGCDGTVIAVCVA
jgi:hypothetical protein